MATFPKNKRCSGKFAKDHRGVLLANVLGKKLHSHWRTSLVSSITPQLRDGMLGGFSGRSTDFASHALRMMTQVAHRDHHSTAFVFTDLVAAFDMMVQQLVMKTRGGDDTIRHLADIMQMPGVTLDQVMQHATGSEAFVSVGVPSHLRHLVATAHNSAWIQVGRRGGLLQPRRGAKPGDPLGDICFNFLCSEF